jgi:hypothetical protein
MAMSTLDREQLIEIVRQNPFIYDPKHQDHRDAQKALSIVHLD